MKEKRMSSEERKQYILSSVRNLICTKGLNVTSKELSEAAGVSEALIYKHFESKEGLYAALMEKSCRGADKVGHELAEQEPSTQILVFSVYLLVHTIFGGMENLDEDFALSPEEFTGLLLQSFQTDGEVARTLFKQGLGPWVPYFQKHMTAAKQSGDLIKQPTDFESLVWIMHHATMGLKITMHPTPNTLMIKNTNEDKLKSYLMSFLLRGIGLKQEAIDEHLNSNEYKKFKQKLEGK